MIRMPFSKSSIAGFVLLGHCGIVDSIAAQGSPGDDTRVVIESRGWQLIGDLCIPGSEKRCPAVLLLNKAAGDRTVYDELARQLAARGIASLRLDLPGHGESVNLGRLRTR